MNSKQLLEYAHRNTPQFDPLFQKVVYAYLHAMLDSTEVQAALENLRAVMQPSPDFFLLSFYEDPDIVQFSDDYFRDILAYSMLRKDSLLYQMISDRFFTGDIGIFYGTDLARDYITETDPVPMRYSDNGLFTDQQPGAQVIVFMNYYSNDEEVASLLELQSEEEVDNASVRVEKLLKIVLPARCSSLLVKIPVLYISDTMFSGIKTTAPSRNPLQYDTFAEILNNASVTWLRSLWTVIGDTGEYEADVEIAATRWVQETSWNGLVCNIQIQASLVGTEWGSMQLRPNREDFNESGFLVYVDTQGVSHTTDLTFSDCIILFTPAETPQVSSDTSTAFLSIYLNLGAS